MGHSNATPYNKEEIAGKVMTLYGDEAVGDKKGIFEYVLGNCQDKSLLNIRLFDEKTKKTKYEIQTADAKERGVSNCPYCAMSDNPNKTKIWALKDMDADHVTPWSQGGSTTADNCQMLCRMHNRAKGNR